MDTVLVGCINKHLCLHWKTWKTTISERFWAKRSPCTSIHCESFWVWSPTTGNSYQTSQSLHIHYTTWPEKISLNYHCIIHQQMLCGKILNMSEVTDITMKIAWFIRVSSSPNSEIKNFLKISKQLDYNTKPEDPQWLLDLAFLTDVTDELNEWNL